MNFLKKQKFFFHEKGYCPICEADVYFQAENEWFRDYLLCSSCGSIPRERALMQVIKFYYPNYKELTIHETSPCNRGASTKLTRECTNYSQSHYFSMLTPGTVHSQYGIRNENIENMTFPEASFDIFISQDVMEHIFNPSCAFKEITRVLKSGGAHIFTVPLVNKGKKSQRWASITESGAIEYHHTPEYHGNPIDNKGSLVTMHWGYDIADFIYKEACMFTTIFLIDNIYQGIRAEFIEVLISKKL